VPSNELATAHRYPATGRLNRPWDPRKIAASPASWIGLALICVPIDYYTGPVIQFPLFYLAPIGLASYYGRARWGLALAVVLPLFRLSFTTIWNPPWTLEESFINAAIRVSVFASFAWLIHRLGRQIRDLRRMHLLEGMLGVCSSCKMIRDTDRGRWQSLDGYLASHPEEFRRELCPACARESGEVFDRR
jgi:hypothetical protein